MVRPDPSDPTAPTRKVEPVAPTTRTGESGSARTRWVTGVFRPGNRTRVLSRTAPTDASRTSVLGTPRQEPAPGGWPRRALRPLAEWSSRLVSRVIVGPASELDYTIPAELRRIYNVLGYIGSGGEAVVYLAEPRSPGGAAAPRLALKVYRPGHDINRALLDRLRARTSPSPYTPAIHGYGHARSSWGEELAWEAQEYFEHGSLRDILDGAPLPEERARDIVAAVAACLRHWQESLQHNHTDVKPENLLVRQADPPVFALTDFGGAVRATMSRVYGGLAITEDYAAPEIVEGRREAPAAWWSLGVMVHEMMTGRRLERGENWLTARSSEVDVSAIVDERWRLLARGLLTPVPDSRWGYTEVNQWLAGERPQVVKPRRYVALRFADVAHDDPPSLAFDLLDRSDKGEVWLRTHWRSLLSWLDREVNDYTFDRGYLTQLDAHPERVHLAISALAARFVPGMPPRYRGHEVTAEGVLALAGGGGSRQAVLREAIEMRALDLAARHWCDHPDCRAGGTNRCARLERVQHEVPLIMAKVTDSVAGLTRESDTGSAPARPESHEWDAAWATATELVLDPEGPRRYRRLLRAQSWHPARRSAAHRADWWREQRRRGSRGRAGEVATNAALVTAMLLLPSAAQAGAWERERQRADSRQRWRARWERGSGTVASGWAAVRDRFQRERDERDDGEGARDPNWWRFGGERDRGRAERRRQTEARRVDRGMRQIQRAMRAGRCRRFALPMALLGLLDGFGQLLLYGVGLSYTAAWVASVDTGVTAFSESAVMAPLSSLMSSLLGLAPGALETYWGFPVVLAVALWLCGRIAANRNGKARRRLMAYRLAVVGSLLMGVQVLTSGLYHVAMGLLIPLSWLGG